MCTVVTALASLYNIATSRTNLMSSVYHLEHELRLRWHVPQVLGCIPAPFFCYDSTAVTTTLRCWCQVSVQQLPHGCISLVPIAYHIHIYLLELLFSVTVGEPRVCALHASRFLVPCIIELPSRQCHVQDETALEVLQEFVYHNHPRMARLAVLTCMHTCKIPFLALFRTGWC